MSNTLLQQFGRRLRIGMVGGGQDGLIGEVHRLSMRVDGYYDLVAGCLSIDRDIARRSAEALLLAPDRTYPDFRTMAEAEAARDDGIDVVTICTPPNTHAEMAQAFMDAGIDVVCEKPMTANAAEAEALAETVRRTGRNFVLTHCYTGYPLIREAREMVRSGTIGRVRQIETDFINGDFMTENPDRSQRHWRFKPEFIGKGAILGEIGTHAIHMASYVSGLACEAVSADFTIFAPGRETYDDGRLSLRFAGGAVGRMWLSFVAAGQEHGMGFRIFGETGSLHWQQEEPGRLILKHPDGGQRVITPGNDWLSDSAENASRLRHGHPEGYVLGFANLYRDFARTIIAQRLGLPADSTWSDVPTVDDGVATMAFFDAAMASQEDDGRWVTLASMLGTK